MSSSYNRYNSQQRRGNAQRATSSWSYWIPVGFTVASAAIGLAIWAWTERSAFDYEDESSNEEERDGISKASGQNKNESIAQDSLRVHGPDSEQTGVFSRVSGVIQRTASPQQLFTGASKTVAAGVAAAGAVVGRGLTALKESDDDFRDHETWSDEAEKQSVGTSARRDVGATTKPKKKRMVCVVISAEDSGSTEDSSILSHLPLHIDSFLVDLLILIYAPYLTSYPLPTGTDVASASPDARLRSQAPSSMTSSYSNIAGDEAGSDDGNLETGADAYNSLQVSALRLVPHPTHILPFTTPTGHVHLLRHLSPSLVYVQAELRGQNGENVEQIAGWVGQVVVVTDGDASSEERIGSARADVIESRHLADDWIRRVGA